MVWNEALLGDREAPLWVRALGEVVREQRYFIAISLGYVAATALLAAGLGQFQLFSVGIYLQFVLGALFLTFALWLGAKTLYLGLVRRTRHPARHITRGVRAFVRQPYKIWSVVIPGLVLLPFMSTFNSFKALIPFIHSFSLDETFMLWDRALHFGTDPWIFTHEIITNNTLTAMIGSIYGLWFIVIWAFLIWQIGDFSQPRQRIRFFISFILTWVFVGSLGAVAFSSAGPVYYGELVAGPNPFTDLMVRLHEIDAAGQGTMFGEVLALQLQDLLWALHLRGEVGIGSGISAMPSMHVAMTTLFAMVAWQRSKALGWIMISYASLIMVGSVHLGWHYAIDGYLGALMVIPIWKLSGYLATRSMANR